MKKRLLKVQNWLLLSLLGMLGVGCHSSKSVECVSTAPGGTEQPAVLEPEVALMYGVPTMDYVVKGRVVDPDNKPVEGVQVILVNSTVDATADTLYGNREHIQNYIRRMADTTDANGNYQVQTTDMPSMEMRLVVRDIDGKRNGSYQNQLLSVPTQQGTANSPRRGWIMGMSISETDVHLKPQDE